MGLSPVGDGVETIALGDRGAHAHQQNLVELVRRAFRASLVLDPGKMIQQKPQPRAARKLTRGNKTEAVALALKRLLDEDARAGSLSGAHRGSVRVRDGIDLVAPILDVEPDAESGREVER